MTKMALCKKTLNDWGTSQNIKIHVFPCTGQIQQTLTQTFSPNSEEEFRREEPNFKAKEKKI